MRQILEWAGSAIGFVGVAILILTISKGLWLWFLALVEKFRRWDKEEN